MRLGQYYQKGLNDLGCEFPSPQGSFHALKRLGWQPKLCIDVGAFQGGWAYMFHTVFPETNILMVEAQESKRATLQQASSAAPNRLRYEIALLGPRDNEEVQFVEMAEGSSVFEESSPFPRKKVAKKLTTLDTLLQRHPDFMQAQILKLDTQGYELEVLKGAPNLLKNVGVILLEVSLIPINARAALFADVVPVMTAHGFKLFDYCGQVRRRDGVLWQIDLLFLHSRSGINIDARLTYDNC